MAHPPIDPHTAERLLRGEIAPADAPPAFAGVASAISRARASVNHETEVPARLIPAMARATATPKLPRRTPVKTILAAKVAGAFIGAISMTGGLAAADVLPPTVSEKVDNVVADTTGVELPGAAERAAAKAARIQARLEEKIAREAAKEKAKAEKLAGTEDADDADEPKGPKGAHPDNHGADVSKAAHDKTVEGRNHGDDVSKVARDNNGHDDDGDGLVDEADEAEDDDDAPGKSGQPHGKSAGKGKSGQEHGKP